MLDFVGDGKLFLKISQMVLCYDSAFYFQACSMKWGDQLVDVVDSIQSGSTLHLFLHPQK